MALCSNLATACTGAAIARRLEWHELNVLDNFEDQDGERLQPEFEQFPALVLIDVPDQPPQNLLMQ